MWAANEAAWELFGLAQKTIWDSWGGVNLSNLRQAAEGLGLAWTEELLRKLLALIEAVSDGDQRSSDD